MSWVTRVMWWVKLRWQAWCRELQEWCRGYYLVTRPMSWVTSTLSWVTRLMSWVSPGMWQDLCRGLLCSRLQQVCRGYCLVTRVMSWVCLIRLFRPVYADMPPIAVSRCWWQLYAGGDRTYVGGDRTYVVGDLWVTCEWQNLCRGRVAGKWRLNLSWQELCRGLLVKCENVSSLVISSAEFLPSLCSWWQCQCRGSQAECRDFNIVSPITQSMSWVLPGLCHCLFSFPLALHIKLCDAPNLNCPQK